MVKGINRRIVEIKNTNSEYFEKAILFIREDKQGLPFDFLTAQAGRFTADLNTGKMQIFRKNVGKRRIIMIAAICLLLAVGFGSLIWLAVV